MTSKPATPDSTNVGTSGAMRPVLRASQSSGTTLIRRVASSSGMYFTAGGLLSSAWVNAVQLIVLLGGLMLAVPVALASVGGLDVILSSPQVNSDKYQHLS